MSEDDQTVAWILPFEELTAAIVLELSEIMPQSDRVGMSSVVLSAIRNALYRYYRQECMWEFNSVADVTAEEILKVVNERKSPF